MQFNSITYAFFLPLVVLAYYASPPRYRAWLLLASSYVFYASWDPVYLVLIVALTVINFALGLAIARSWQPQVLMWTGILIDIGVLALYKYSTFFVTNINDLFVRLGVNSTLATPNLVLPLALSFFTFEFVHYLVDVNKGKGAVSNLLDFALFACFFPTQVAGPIKRFEDFIPQVRRVHRFDERQFWSGLGLVLLGLGKKVVLADSLAPQVALAFGRVAAGGALGVADAWLAVVAFAFQIYFDFCGYTDMGRGSALMLGFVVPENFRRPYLATNISEFWRRWHISLSSWLRDYVYISLGGNRGSRDRNLFATMVLGGLWHGANWTFVLWGMLHGLYLIGLWRWRTWRSVHTWAWRGPLLGPVLGWATTFGLVCIGWVFFRAATLWDGARMLKAMAAQYDAPALTLAPMTVLFIVGVAGGWLLLELIQEWSAAGSPRATALVRAWSWPVPRWRSQLRPVAYVLLLAIILLAKPEAGARFIYFQF